MVTPLANTFTKSLVKFDTIADYTPGLSTVTSVVNLFLKEVVPVETAKGSHHFTHIKNKQTWRSCLLLIPLLGNILVLIVDLIRKAKAAKLAQAQADYD